MKVGLVGALGVMRAPHHGVDDSRSMSWAGGMKPPGSLATNGDWYRHGALKVADKLGGRHCAQPAGAHKRVRVPGSPRRVTRSQEHATRSGGSTWNGRRTWTSAMLDSDLRTGMRCCSQVGRGPRRERG